MIEYIKDKQGGLPTIGLGHKGIVAYDMVQ